MMLTSLLFVTLSVFLCAALLGSALASTRLSIHRRDSEAAFELAEAGVQHAKLQLEKDPKYLGQQNTTFGDGWFRVEIGPHPGDATRLQLVSTGRVLSGKGGYIERQVRSALGWSRPHPIWKYTILANELVDLKERLTADSDPEKNKALVHSNNRVELGSVTIRGRATAVTSVVTASGTKVTEGTESGVSAVELPTLDKAALMAEAAAKGTHTGDLTLDSGQHTLRGMVVGNVTITGSAAVDIKGPIWITGNLTISGRSWSGNGGLFVNGKIRLDTSSSILENSVDDLALVSFSTANDAITITSRDNSDKVTVRGGVLAPVGGIVLGGKVAINGSVIGRQVTGQGHGSGIDVYRSTTFQPPVAVLPAIEFWEAL